VLLILQHPRIAHRSCEDCQRWLYDDGPDGTQQLSLRGGRPQRRPKASATPCRTEQGCPAGTPEAQNRLSDKNTHAFAHYLECRAVGQFPDDPIVRQNAAIIRQAEEEAKEFRMVRALGPLAALIGALHGR
jgi:hypothetical protein